MRSPERSRVVRWGADVHGEKAQPAARASSSITGSASTRTECPRATRRFATPSSGGTVPPPSHIVKRNLIGSPIARPPFRGPVRDERTERLDQGLLGGRGGGTHSPPPQVPGIEFRRADELAEAPLVERAAAPRQVRRERLREPPAVERARIRQYRADRGDA